MYIELLMIISTFLARFDYSYQNVKFIAKSNAPYKISSLTNSTGYQVIALDNFGYVCAWKNKLSYYAVAYDNNSNAISNLIIIFTFITTPPPRNDYNEFNIAALTENRFIVVWEICSNGVTVCAPVFAVYNSDGTKYIPQTAVTTETGNVPITSPYYPPPNVITLTDGGFMISWVLNGKYLIRFYNSYFATTSLEIEIFEFAEGISGFYRLPNSGFLVTNLKANLLTLTFFDISGNYLKDKVVTLATGNGPNYSKILIFNENIMLLYCYIHNTKLNLINQIFDVTGSTLSPMGTFPNWDTTLTATIPLDFIILKNGLYAVTWTDTVNGFIKILDNKGANYYSYSFNINSNNERPRIADLNNGGLVGIYGIDQVSATLIDFKGVCLDFSIFFGRIDFNRIIFPTFDPSGNNIIITQLPQNGQIFKGTTVGQRNENYLVTEVNYVTQSLVETDSFFYKVDLDDIPCRVSLIACYKSCKSCLEKGDSNNHKCSSCLTSDNYHLNPVYPQNCFKIDDVLDGYYYSAKDQIFQKCYEACKLCSNSGTPEETNCLSCDIAKGYYPLQDLPNQCYLKTVSLDGYYSDDTNQIFGKCYDTCKSCYGSGNSGNPNCIECKPNADCTPIKNITLTIQDKCDNSYENKCIDDCPEFKVFNTTSKDCYSCSSVSLKYYNKTCTEDCPHGYTDEDGKCVECSDKIMNCSTKLVNQEQECSNENCSFHGICKLLMNQITCECQAGYLGHSCQYTGFDINEFLSKLF
jgi:hypothetical protein